MLVDLAVLPSNSSSPEEMLDSEGANKFCEDGNINNSKLPFIGSTRIKELVKHVEHPVTLQEYFYDDDGSDIDICGRLLPLKDHCKIMMMTMTQILLTTEAMTMMTSMISNPTTSYYYFLHLIS